MRIETQYYETSVMFVEVSSSRLGPNQYIVMCPLAYGTTYKAIVWPTVNLIVCSWREHEPLVFFPRGSGNPKNRQNPLASLSFRFTKTGKQSKNPVLGAENL